jgi:hypothetical protein
MNPGELFKSRAFQILIATNVIGATVGFFYGPKIIEQIIGYRNFQDAQKILQSANTLCEKTNKSIVSAEDIPKSIMDQLSVAGPTVETPWIESLHILGSSGVAVFACEPKRPVLPGTELSQIFPLHPSTALTQIFQHHNSRG